MPPSEPLVCVWNGRDRLRCDGVTLGLLRDNIEHASGRQLRSEPWVQIHSLADAAWRRATSQLMPSELCTELRAGWELIWRVPVRELVLSDGTRALLRRQLGPFPRTTDVASWLRRQCEFGPSSTTLGELTANLVHGVFSLAARARPGEVLRCAPQRMLDESGDMSERVIC